MSKVETSSQVGVEVSVPVAHTRGGILADAERYCREHDLRLTAGRRRVLSLLAGEGRAVKAYDLLGALTAPGGKSMPPVVYRALDFWIEHGFVHRIESLNAYTACGHPLHSHGCQLLVCTACEQVIEVCNRRLRGNFEATASEHGFSFDRAVLEIYGRCPACRQG